MEKKLREHHVGSLVLRGLMYLAAGITVVALLYVLFYILVNGVPALFTSKGIFSTKYNSENVSLLPSLINTLKYSCFFCCSKCQCPLHIAFGNCSY